MAYHFRAIHFKLIALMLLLAVIALTTSPVVGQGPLVDGFGVKRSSNGFFYLRNSLTTGTEDWIVAYGFPTDVGIVGDWNGNGTDTVGYYRPSTSGFVLSNQTPDTLGGFPPATSSAYLFGVVGDQPVAGDWDGDGRDSTGVYRESDETFYLRNLRTGGAADIVISVPWAEPGDIPVVGDWNGDLRDSPGVYRPSQARFYLTNRFFSGVGGLHYSQVLGLPGDLPVIGDWNGDNRDGVGVYRNGQVFLRNTIGITGPADITFVFGVAGDRPLAGKWIPGCCTAPLVINAEPVGEPAQSFEP
jgi:hypothetical protein